jgi:hypothetical protein
VRGARIRILGQQPQHLLAVLAFDVGCIDAGIPQDKTEPMRDHDHARAPAHDFARFAQDEFDHPRILADFGGERLGPR